MRDGHEPPRLRLLDESDLASVAQLFTDSVHQIASQYYDPDQLAAWAPVPPDLELWRHRLGGLETWVAEVEGRLAGFLSVGSNGYVAYLYVSPRDGRRGVASALHRHAEAALVEAGATELFTEASLAARPFFERVGFQVVEEQQVCREGMILRRFAMRKPLRGA